MLDGTVYPDQRLGPTPFIPTCRDERCCKRPWRWAARGRSVRWRTR